MEPISPPSPWRPRESPTPLSHGAGALLRAGHVFPSDFPGVALRNQPGESPQGRVAGEGAACLDPACHQNLPQYPVGGPPAHGQESGAGDAGGVALAAGTSLPDFLSKSLHHGPLFHS